MSLRASSPVVLISDMGKKTTPYVTGDEWAAIFSKYTNNIYRGTDKITYKPYVLDVLVKLFKSMGQQGLRHLIAWSVFRQMVHYTEPTILLRNQTASDVCYKHVQQVMNLALLNRYLSSVVSQKTVDRAAAVVEDVRKAFRKALESSSWVKSQVREVAIRKLNNLKVHVGSPAGRLDTALLETYYVETFESQSC
ncbi:uncharacterized protein LOC142574733 [Dermacentor variabilis]|uniref:uncharacterized protein LOC142574733 n=1 Tax=Dermacentor variabilis TaxID=34621 RepID=UPI003F5C8DE2